MVRAAWSVVVVAAAGTAAVEGGGRDVAGWSSVGMVCELECGETTQMAPGPYVKSKPDSHIRRDA